MQEHPINVNEDENASLTFEAFYKRFQKMTCSVKLRHSDQRETLLKVLFKTQKHLSAKEIQTLLKNEHRVGVSLATVYKQLLLLEMLDLASVVVTFPKKTKRYRLKHTFHHDHLVCVKCGRIIPFYDPVIETEQEAILAHHHFTGIHHTMVLYGICERCHRE